MESASSQAAEPVLPLVDLDSELAGLNASLDRLVELLEVVTADEAAEAGLAEFLATACGIWFGLGREDLAAVCRQLYVVMLNVKVREAGDG